jgi:hypothetical protein
MADLGSIGVNGAIYQGRATYPQAQPYLLRSLVADGRYMVLGKRDDAEGTADAPSLKMNNRGEFRFRWRVASGSRTVTVSVKQPINLSPRPTLTVKANPEIGVNADVSSTAPSGAGWVAIGPVSVSPTSAGVLFVVLNARYDSQLDPCWWDQIVVT